MTTRAHKAPAKIIPVFKPFVAAQVPKGSIMKNSMSNLKPKVSKSAAVSPKKQGIEQHKTTNNFETPKVLHQTKQSLLNNTSGWNGASELTPRVQFDATKAKRAPKHMQSPSTSSHYYRTGPTTADRHLEAQST